MRHYKNIVITIIAAASIIVAGYFLVTANHVPPTNVTITNPVTSPVAATSTHTAQKNNSAGLKTYRNTEYGFEFEYPSNFLVKENPYGSPSSKFNLVVDALDNKGKHYDVFVINIATPEFADGSFLGVGGTVSSSTIGSVPGVRYHYKFEGLPETSIVLPLGKYKIILGIDSVAEFYGYENSFNQILSTFKFLK